MKKHFLLSVPEIVNTISGALKEHDLFRSSKNCFVWQSPGHHFYNTTVLFFSKEPREREYSLLIQQRDHRAILSLYAKQVVINSDDGSASDNELILFTATIGSESKKTRREITPEFGIRSETPFGMKQVAILAACTEAILAKKIECAQLLDFKTTIVIDDDTLPPPNLMNIFEDTGLITSGAREKREA